MNSETIGRLTINLTYDVPYLAGYNKRGTVIYIDRRVPPRLPIGRNDTLINILDPLAMHEEIEDRIEELFGYPYDISHEIATAAEYARIEQLGGDVVKYDHLMRILIAKCRESFTYLPPDLDMQPYVDSKDFALIRKMKTLQQAGRIYI